MEFHNRSSLSSRASQKLQCRVGKSESIFGVNTSVRQGCPMTVLLFNLTIDWVMRQTTSDRPPAIRLTTFSILEDLDFALVSHTHRYMLEKSTRLSMFVQQVGIKMRQRKTEGMTLNVQNITPIKVNGEDLPPTEEFTYLGSIARHDGGAGNDSNNNNIYLHCTDSNSNWSPSRSGIAST